MVAFKGFTHLVIGIGGGLLLRNVFGIWGVAMAALGSLLPDIDHPYSTIGRRIPVADAFKMQHRGWTHSLLGLGIFTALVAIIDTKLAIGLALGYVLHLLADSLTPVGVAWFYPISKNRRHIIGIRTGGKLENVLAWTLLYVMLLLLWWTW